MCRKKNVFLLCALLGHCGAWAQLPGQAPVCFESFKEVEKNFSSPPSHFGTAPFFVWNAEMDSAGIRDIIRQYKANACGGFFIHPRPGLITPYLSDHWVDLFGYAVAEAKKQGLDVWIYDEDSYPSGFGGGWVPALMPSSYNEGEMLELTKDSVLPASGGDFFIVLKKEQGKYTDITSVTGAWKGQPGDYYLFKKTRYYSSPWYGGFSYVDLMKKGVTEKFIDVTMKPYERKFGGEFGKTVMGVFSDEPNIEVQYPSSIRWTPALFDSFYRNWNYHLENNLPSLFDETGDWRKVRHDYYHTLLQLFIEGWSKPFSDYAQQHKLEWTGHYWEHEWPSPNHGPDNMAMYAWPQRPGIDMLFNQFNEEDVNAQFGNVRSVKELASVANQLNKKRVLSETYGGGGWELTFQDMKRLGDWEMVLGINTINQHLSFTSIEGARKYDYPQSFSYHAPWWPYYRFLNAYFARLTLALSSGAQVNDILVIEPTTTAWMYFSYDRPDTVFRKMGSRFQHFITRLEKSQVEYDLGSENIIADHGRTDSTAFIIGNRSYHTVVIPPGMENIDSPTFLLLKRFAANGGRVMQFQPLQRIDGSPSDRLDTFYTVGYPGLVRLDSLDEGLIHQFLRDQGCDIALEKGGDLYHYRRQLPEGQIVFLSNASLLQHARADLAIRARDVLMLDPFTGKLSAYPHSLRQDTVRVDVDLYPGGSLLLYFSKAPLHGYPQPVLLQKKRKALEAPMIIRRESDNSLTIDFCDLKIGDTLFKDKHVYDAADTVFKHYGFKDGNPWNTSVQFQDHTIRRDNFSLGTGFTADYYFQVAPGVVTKNLKAVAEMQCHWQVYINGRLVRPVSGKWWLDKAFGVFAIGDFVHPGKNSLRLVANPMSVHAEIEPVYILGDFCLAPAAKGWEIVPARPLRMGSWRLQGMPMYGQSVSYRKTFNVQGHLRKYLVALGDWKGTVAVVKVNNKTAGVIMAPPGELDISRYVSAGNNLVEVQVIGSLKNVLGPFHNQPVPGLVSPWHWRYVKNYPSGSQYDLLDYGLMDDFSILQE